MFLFTSCTKKAKVTDSVAKEENQERYEFEMDPDMPYSNLSKIISKMDENITVYKGLPHQNMEYEKYKEELKKGNNHKRKDFHFYKKPIEFDLNKVQQLVKVLKNPENFSKRIGVKECGGFHPDFSVVSGTGISAIEIHICLGCHEIKAYKENIIRKNIRHFWSGG